MPQDRAALMEALSLMRRSELILATGWPPDVLDAQDSDEVERLETYLGIKSAVQAQMADLGPIGSNKRRRG